MAVLFSALTLNTCHRSPDDSAEAVPSAVFSVSPSASAISPCGEFHKSSYRADFARKFSDTLKIREGSEDFFLPIDYRWKLEMAMAEAAGVSESTGDLPDDEVKKAENAVLTIALKKLFDEWARIPLEAHEHDIFRSPYHREVYRHYYFLRSLEVLPDRPQKKGTGDLEKLVKEWSDFNRQTWQLTHDSPYYGLPKGKKEAGPFDKPFQKTILDLIEKMVREMPPKGSPYYSSSYESQFRTSVLDMYLPGMYLRAISDRMNRAGVSAEEIGFDRETFEKELKKALTYRTRAFFKSGRLYSGDKINRRVFNIVGVKFKELSEMEHPLELYIQP